MLHLIYITGNIYYYEESCAELPDQSWPQFKNNYLKFALDLYV